MKQRQGPPEHEHTQTRGLLIMEKAGPKDKQLGYGEQEADGPD